VSRLCSWWRVTSEPRAPPRASPLRGARHEPHDCRLTHKHAHPPHPPPAASHRIRPAHRPSTGKYRAHNNIDGSPVNDFIATCILGTGMCQMLNDYELKNGGSFEMMGKFVKAGGAPEAIVMEA
jgi:hypothetical protein